MNDNHDFVLKKEQQRQMTPKNIAPSQITPKSGQIIQIKSNLVQIKKEEQNDIMINRKIN